MYCILNGRCFLVGLAGELADILGSSGGEVRVLHFDVAAHFLDDLQ